MAEGVNPVFKPQYHRKKKSLVVCTSVVCGPAVVLAEAGGSLEPRKARLAWAA
jgi:hypothetical protein